MVHKILVILFAVCVCSASMYVVTRGARTELDVQGTKYYEQSAYSTQADALLLKQIEDVLVKEQEQANGDKVLENEATERASDKRKQYYVDLYNRNIERFHIYTEKLKSKLNEIEKDKYLFRDYVRFTSLAQNKKFLEAAELLKTIETKLGMKILD